MENARQLAPSLIGSMYTDWERVQQELNHPAQTLEEEDRREPFIAFLHKEGANLEARMANTPSGSLLDVIYKLELTLADMMGHGYTIDDEPSVVTMLRSAINDMRRMLNLPQPAQDD